jgi:3-methyl-2-oxobutanoate hydroxymethyltransferase
LVKEAGVDLVKLDGASDFLDAVTAIDRAGIPVYAQFGITPQTALRYGVPYSATPSPDTHVPVEMTDELVTEAKRLKEAGASLLNFTNSGPVVGEAVARAVSIPVLGGFGGGPWLDGRMRMATAAIGYSADGLDNPPDTYASVAQIAFDSITAYAEDVRAGRQIRGGIPVAPAK